MLFTTILTTLTPVLGPLQDATLPLPSDGESGENPLDSVVNILMPSEDGEGGLPGLATQIETGIGAASGAVSGGIATGADVIGAATGQVAEGIATGVGAASGQIGNVSAVIGEVTTGVTGGITQVVNLAAREDGIFPQVIDGFTDLIDGITDLIADLPEAANVLVPQLAAAANILVPQLVTAVEESLGAIAGALEALQFEEGPLDPLADSAGESVDSVRKALETFQAAFDPELVQKLLTDSTQQIVTSLMTNGEALVKSLPDQEDFSPAVESLMSLGDQFEGFAETLQMSADTLSGTLINQLSAFQGIFDGLVPELNDPEMPFGELPDLGALEDVLSGSFPGLEGLNDILSLINGGVVSMEDKADTDEDTAININVSENDTPIVQKVSLLSNESENGALLLINEDGTINYDPRGKFDDLNVDNVVMDSFLYEATLVTGQRVQEIVTVAVRGVDDDPTIEIVNLNAATISILVEDIDNQNGNVVIPGSNIENIALNTTLPFNILPLSNITAGHAEVVSGKGLAQSDEFLMFGTDAADIISAQNSPSVIYTFDGKDIVDGGALEDVVYLGGGNDTLRGFTTGDRVDGGDGDDTVRLNASSTALDAAKDIAVQNIEIIDFSNSGSNISVNLANQTEGLSIFGGAFSDLIMGSSGDDFIIGRGGDDTIFGGIGADKFFYELQNGRPADGIDTYVDFTSGEDIFESNFTGIKSSALQEITRSDESFAFSRGTVHMLVDDFSGVDLFNKSEVFEYIVDSYDVSAPRSSEFVFALYDTATEDSYLYFAFNGRQFSITPKASPFEASDIYGLVGVFRDTKFAEGDLFV